MTAATMTMKHINENRLEKDLGDRFSYLTEFMGFGPEDVEQIRAAAPHLAPLVPLPTPCLQFPSAGSCEAQ
jgi:hypothetical protein